MKAEIISIGDELLIGQTVNTNAAFIGNSLAELSIEVERSVSIADIREQIISEFNIAFAKYDLVIVTGGLGPTHDDLTKSCVVDYFETELVENEKILENIKQLFEKRGRQVTQVNEEQALIPKIAEAILNERGTAPGMWIEKDNKIMIVLPGVPYEMKGMMQDFIIPKLSDMLTDEETVTRRLILQTTGIPESTLYERLGDLDELIEGAKLAFLPNQFGVKLRITVAAETDEAAKEKLTAIEQKIRRKAGRFIFGKNDETLEEVVGRLLKERDFKISIAESCTGGNLSDHLTNISGSSSYFERGVIAYSNAAKVEILKVDEDTIQEHGSVSREVSMQMAEGVKSTSGTNIGISITGIMGPTGATTNKPVGLVYIGYCDDSVCTAKKFIFGEDRLLNKERTTQAALDLIRRQLLGISYDD